jgi:hypothetical protein
MQALNVIKFSEVIFLPHVFVVTVNPRNVMLLLDWLAGMLETNPIFSLYVLFCICDLSIIWDAQTGIVVIALMWYYLYFE